MYTYINIYTHTHIYTYVYSCICVNAVYNYHIHVYTCIIRSNGKSMENPHMDVFAIQPPFLGDFPGG